MINSFLVLKVLGSAVLRVRLDLRTDYVADGSNILETQSQQIQIKQSMCEMAERHTAQTDAVIFTS